MEREGFQYCPVCGRWIEAINREEVARGEHVGFVYSHDDVPHSDEDMVALARGIN